MFANGTRVKLKSGSEVNPDWYGIRGTVTGHPYPRISTVLFDYSPDDSQPSEQRVSTKNLESIMLANYGKED